MPSTTRVATGTYLIKPDLTGFEAAIKAAVMRADAIVSGLSGKLNKALSGDGIVSQTVADKIAAPFEEATEKVEASGKKALSAVERNQQEIADIVSRYQTRSAKGNAGVPRSDLDDVKKAAAAHLDLLNKNHRLRQQLNKRIEPKINTKVFEQVSRNYNALKRQFTMQHSVIDGAVKKTKKTIEANATNLANIYGTDINREPKFKFKITPEFETDTKSFDMFGKTIVHRQGELLRNLNNSKHRFFEAGRNSATAWSRGMQSMNKSSSQIFYGLTRGGIAALIPALLAGVGAAGFAGVAFGVHKIAGAVDTANASATRARGAFKQFFGEIERLSNATPQMSNAEFFDMSSAVMSSLRSSGWDQQMGTAMSAQIIEQANNVAATVNQPLEDVMNSIMQALSGSETSLSSIIGFEDIDTDMLDEMAKATFGLSKEMDDLTSRQRQFIVTSILDDRASGMAGAAAEKAANTYAGKLAEMKSKFADVLSSGLGQAVMGKAMTALEYIGNKGVVVFERLLAAIASIPNDVITDAIDGLAEGFTTLIAMLPNLIAFFGDMFNIVMKVLPYLIATVRFIADNFETIKNIALVTAGLFIVLQVLVPIFTLLSSIVSIIFALGPVFTALGSMIGAAFTAVVAAVGGSTLLVIGAIVAIALAIGAVILTLTDSWGKFFNWLGDQFRRLWNWVKGTFKAITPDFDMSAFEELKQIDVKGLDVDAAKFKEEQYFKALEKTRLNVDMDNYQAAFQRDHKKGTSMALETLTFYNI